MKPTGKLCKKCGVVKAFKDMVRNVRCSYDCEAICKVCRDTRSKPQYQRRDRARTERRRAEKKMEDDLWEETVQLEIDYYAKQVAAIRQGGLKPGSNAGQCDMILKG